MREIALWVMLTSDGSIQLVPGLHVAASRSPLLAGRRETVRSVSFISEAVLG